MHVLPLGFYKVRYYGILASANSQKRQLCFGLLGKQPAASLLQGLNARAALKVITGKDPALCPACKQGAMHVEKVIPGQPKPP